MLKKFKRMNSIADKRQQKLKAELELNLNSSLLSQDTPLLTKFMWELVNFSVAYKTPDTLQIIEEVLKVQDTSIINLCLLAIEPLLAGNCCNSKIFAIILQVWHTSDCTKCLILSILATASKSVTDCLLSSRLFLIITEIDSCTSLEQLRLLSRVLVNATRCIDCPSLELLQSLGIVDVLEVMLNIDDTDINYNALLMIHNSLSLIKDLDCQAVLLHSIEALKHSRDPLIVSCVVYILESFSQ